MQDRPSYGDVVSEVIDFLLQRKQACLDAGIASDQILLDPGFGFGKTLDHNLALFNALEQFAASGHPLLVGVSRKTMIGQLLDSDVDQRLIGSVTMALLAAQKIAAQKVASQGVILRVHDVLETVQALIIWQSVNKFKEES
jgi:dihydropteroate synthase